MMMVCMPNRPFYFYQPDIFEFETMEFLWSVSGFAMSDLLVDCGSTLASGASFANGADSKEASRGPNALMDN